MTENRIPNAHLSSGPVLARNTAWNLLGYVAPMVVAAFTIPPLIHTLGKDRFGVLALGWTMVGYFSLFDLRVGRGLTIAIGATFKFVSDNVKAAPVWIRGSGFDWLRRLLHELRQTWHPALVWRPQFDALSLLQLCCLKHYG